jgi:hypothetical protein
MHESLFGTTEQLRRGIVKRIDGDVIVEVEGEDRTHEVTCDILRTSEASPLLLAPRDVVVCWCTGPLSDRGVILGRIGPSHAVAHTPDTLLIEAKEELTLRVGEGSITIRADGKILIKGKDLVSHAQRVNRIRGGSVAIN